MTRKQFATAAALVVIAPFAFLSSADGKGKPPPRQSPTGTYGAGTYGSGNYGGV